MAGVNGYLPGMSLFLTADWHLGDERLDKLQRPFGSVDDMHRALVREHNLLVAPDDELIVVGDVVAADDPELLELVPLFHGRKTLLRGNQDRRFSDDELAPYFELVLEEGEGLELDVAGIPLYATHYPTQGHAERFNLVGHVHKSWQVQLNSLNVGVDVHNYRPLPLERVPFFVTGVSDYYDEDVWVAYHDLNARYRGQRGKPGSYFSG